MDEEEIQHLKDLLSSYTRNLRQLELQAVQYGDDIPIHITNSILSSRKKIEELKQDIQEKDWKFNVDHGFKNNTLNIISIQLKLMYLRAIISVLLISIIINFIILALLDNLYITIFTNSILLLLLLSSNVMNLFGPKAIIVDNLDNISIHSARDIRFNNVNEMLIDNKGVKRNNIRHIQIIRIKNDSIELDLTYKNKDLGSVRVTTTHSFLINISNYSTSISFIKSITFLWL